MTIGLIYIACLTIGIGYALWTGLLGPGFDGDAGGHGGDFSVDHGGEFLDFDSSHGHGGEVHFTPISPQVLAAFLGAFGALGVIGHYALKLSWWRGLLLASFAGVIIAGVFYYVVRGLYSVTQASSEAHVSDLIGEEAETTVAIPTGGTGEITYSSIGTRYQAPAREYQSQGGIPHGARVEIKRIEGGVYYVMPLPVQTKTETIE